ncbi:MAG: hypothetical protein LBN29_13940, partial [Mediterranea sp.]|nr:hypothetical protein [Mediterranea sp.]
LLFIISLPLWVAVGKDTPFGRRGKGNEDKIGRPELRRQVQAENRDGTERVILLSRGLEFIAINKH